MTHAIQEDSPSYTGPSFKAEYRKATRKPEDLLLEQLIAHYAYMKEFTDDKHVHKKNVLEAAMNALNNKGSIYDVMEAIKQNPNYNQAIFPSETKKLVDKAIELAPEKDKPLNLNQEQEQLITDLKNHFNSVSGKHDEKHQHKQVVISKALEVMNGKASVDDLKTVMEKNPRYDEALFKSKTEALIEKALELGKDFTHTNSAKL